MAAESAPRSTPAIPDGVGTLEGATAVISCSRLGRTANPPTFSLTGWLRPRRRRYGGVSGA